jgi:hypothetical protein
MRERLDEHAGPAFDPLEIVGVALKKPVESARLDKEPASLRKVALQLPIEVEQSGP